MKYLFLLGFVFLSSCQPKSAERASSADVSASLSVGQQLRGVWVGDRKICESLREADCNFAVYHVEYFENVMTLTLFDIDNNDYFPGSKSRNIKFNDDNSYEDYYVNETVKYNLTGNQLQICYQAECYNLKRK